MITRTIHMISNTYSSNFDNAGNVLGRYCVFGPYDAMDIDEEAQKWDGQTGRSMNELDIEMYDGKSSRCGIICAVSSANITSERIFIEKLNDYPFLFISLLLLNHKQVNKEEVIAKVNKINKEETCRVYFSSGKNELVLLHCCCSFNGGLDMILEKHGLIPALLKTSTIFAVQEDALDRRHLLYSHIADGERVSCRLRCFVKDREKAKKYLMKLGEYVMSHGACSMKWYNILGSADILVEIDKVPLKYLLLLYKTKWLLTHMNKRYNSAWYNIETEFISNNGGMDYGEYYKDNRRNKDALSKM